LSLGCHLVGDARQLIARILHGTDIISFAGSALGEISSGDGRSRNWPWPFPHTLSVPKIKDKKKLHNLSKRRSKTKINQPIHKKGYIIDLTNQSIKIFQIELFIKTNKSKIFINVFFVHRQQRSNYWQSNKS
jgi:hypothetical protein